MVLTIKKPASKRFFQVSFEGFKPAGRNRAEQFVKLVVLFVKSLWVYFAFKLFLIFKLLVSMSTFLFKLPVAAKAYLIKKLIWSRGRLGRAVASAFVLTASLVAFLIGEVFSSSSLIVTKPVSADYLAVQTDIIPRKEIALTAVPESRKTEYTKYKVAPGDSLFSIGNKFKISVDALQYVNDLTDNSVLSIGQDITIPPLAGLIHKVEQGDTLSSIAYKYEVPSQAIMDFNYLFKTDLTLGQELVIPNAKIPKVIPAYVANAPISQGLTAAASPSRSFCVWPTTVRIVTQYYNWYHNGVDIATPWNGPMPPLLACTGGTVIRAGWDPFGLGLHIRVDHGNGYETVYGHMSRIDVSYGEHVKRGEVMGLMGNTGNSTGPHIHFMVKYNGVAQNPFDYMN